MSEENSNIQALLDANLDDLADLPEFRPFSAGTHKVTVTLAPKEIAKHPAVEAKFKLIETLELADPTEENPSKPGDEASVAFMLDNEFGQGALKKFLAPFKEQYNTGNLREIIEQSKGAELVISTNIQTDSKDSTKKYLRVVSAQFA